MHDHNSFNMQLGAVQNNRRSPGMIAPVCSAGCSAISYHGLDPLSGELDNLTGLT